MLRRNRGAAGASNRDLKSEAAAVHFLLHGALHKLRDHVIVDDVHAARNKFNSTQLCTESVNQSTLPDERSAIYNLKTNLPKLSVSEESSTTASATVK